MSSTPVHTGPWWDWSSQKQYVWTTRSSNANLWLNLIAFALGTFVLGACWNVVAFLLHYFGDKYNPAANDTGLHRHHRLIWRNVGDPWSAALELLTVYWAWKRTTIQADRIGLTQMSPKWIAWRTVRAMLIPIGLFGGFTGASILAAKITLTGNNVLIKAHATGKCGFAQYQNGSFLNHSTSTEVLLSFQSTALRDTVAGRAYARSCYSQDFAATVSCSFFVRPSLAYSSYQHDQRFGCPFGEPDLSFDTSPCNASENTGAYLMYTDILNSNVDLGINARPEDQVEFQKNTTCSVVNPIPYEVSTKGYNTSPYNYTYQAYCLGPLGSQDTFAPCGIETSTFFYNPAENEFSVGYQTEAVLYNSHSFGNVWHALPEFRRDDGDTTLVAVMANSIQYTAKVYDPLFRATSPSNAAPSSGLETVYVPYYPLNIMGCIDQYIICNPGLSKCTPPSGIADLVNNYGKLELNAHQQATAFRIVSMLQTTNTYSNTWATGDTALKASDKALNSLSMPLPYDQWIIEIKGWFETGLAKMQAYTVQYAANTDNEGDIGYVDIPQADGQLREAYLDQCASQKVKTTGNFQNLSLTGIIIVAIVGGLLFIVGSAFHPAILPLIRRFFESGSPKTMTKHQRDYKADSKYHLYFMAVEDRNNPYKYRMHDECPTFPDNPRLPNPGERVDDHANVYHNAVAIIPVAGNQTHPPGQQNTSSQAGAQSIPLSTLTRPGASGAQHAPPPTTNAAAGTPSAGSSQGPPSASGSQQPLLPATNVPAGPPSATSSQGTPSTASSTANHTATTPAPPVSNTPSPPAQGPNVAATTTAPQSTTGQLGPLSVPPAAPAGP